MRREGPPEFRDLRLISMDELQEIRRIWLHEKHEFDDSLPRIYEQATGQAFPKAIDDGVVLRGEDWELLREVCGEDQALFELQVALLGVEQDYRGMARRAGIFDDLKKRLRNFYANEEEAVRILSGQKRRRQEAIQLSALRKDLERGDDPTGPETDLLTTDGPE